ncbi:MAG TPA: response regulator, partial [Steroidobacteraceae bacterium]|nr:response regulator [Steroidobacteraceae bacterium]
MSFRVLIVDDEPPARALLRSMLAEFEGFEVTAEAENGRRALEICDQQPPDIVLLDVRMPGID